ncbi:MAG: hypothetical protein L6425_09365 [Candidatus Aminicenantes bacterium]|nr:hypothetical protein [Candidatus Aminicenantes bacterium]
MKRLNITIDDELYRKVKALAFFNNKSFSSIIRDSLGVWIEGKMTKKEELILKAEDEEEILDILERDEFVSLDEIKTSFKE